MPADPVEAAAAELYALPLEAFTRERDARAKALRKAGDKAAADQVAKLAKPSQVAGAINALAREQPDLVGALLSAGEELRSAQLGGGGREAVRAATGEEREAVEALVKAAGKLSRAAQDRLRAALHAAAADEAVGEQIREGRMVAEPEAGGAWPAGAFSIQAPPAQPKEGGKRAPAAPPKRDRESVARRKRDEEKARKAAERAKREAERNREEAERRKLERRLKAARSAADDARNRLEAARDAYESACDEVARIEEQLS
jgi:hypothetical protein